MKTKLFLLTLVSGLTLAGSVFAADNKAYVASGRVISSRPNVIRVHTPTQNMDIMRDATTKVTGDVRKGANVVVHYMKVAGLEHATDITVTK